MCPVAVRLVLHFYLKINNRAETKPGLQLVLTTVSVTSAQFGLCVCPPIKAAWTPAWQTPPVRACSVVARTAEGAVAV